MGRIRQMIAVDGRKCWTLFDSGARNTYVIPRRHPPEEKLDLSNYPDEFVEF
jgi:hypothetical protein